MRTRIRMTVGLALLTILMGRQPSAAQLADAQSAFQGSGGAAVEDARAFQFAYADSPDGNSVELSWVEVQANATGIDVSVFDENGGLIRRETAPALDPDSVPAFNEYRLTNLPAGALRFRISAEATPSATEVGQVVVADPPIQNVRCVEGRSDADGVCQLVTTWRIALPNLVSFAQDLVVDNDVDQPFVVRTSTRESSVVESLGSGDYLVTLRAFLETSGGSYRSRVSTRCRLTCSGESCLDPLDFFVRQIGYEASEGSNAMSFNWITTGDYEDVLLLVDGVPVRSVNRASTEFRATAEVHGLVAGEHTFAIQGLCGDPNAVPAPPLTARVEQVFEVVNQTPHPRPVTGPVFCEFVDDGNVSRTILSWTAATRSESVDIWIANKGELIFGGSTALPGTPQFFLPFLGTLADDVFLLRFYINLDGSRYASSFVSCGRGSAIAIRGVCNGVGSFPNVSSAIFGIRWLFGSRERPPCQEACNSNGDQVIDLSDMVYLLNFLFDGGPPPANWVDATTPVCELFPVQDCVQGYPACPF